jgi:hypothetical protein
MIIGLGSDKGAPGSTTLAAALAQVWSGPRLLLELDPRGADLPLRLTRPDGTALLEAPSLVGLALAARGPGDTPAIERFAQLTAQGFPVIAGEMSTRAYARIVTHLPDLARLAQAWPGAVFTDVGPLQPSNPAMVAARAASCVLTVTRPTLEGFAHLRDNLTGLAEAVADPRRTRPPLGVVVVVPAKAERAALRQTRSLLEQLDSPAQLVGALAFDPAGVEMLWQAPDSKKFPRTALYRSASRLAGQIVALWPQLDPNPAVYRAPAPGAAPVREVTA